MIEALVYFAGVIITAFVATVFEVDDKEDIMAASFLWPLVIPIALLLSIPIIGVLLAKALKKHLNKSKEQLKVKEREYLKIQRNMALDELSKLGQEIEESKK